MLNSTLPPIDYLVIGHLACDRTPDGNTLGGTAAYASLTAAVLGQRTGIITATGRDVSLTLINHLPRAGILVPQSTTFENIYTPDGRTQILHHHAPILTPDMIPASWQDASIVHIAPIVHEVAPDLLNWFPDSFIGVTPQGWLRQWDNSGRVTPGDWPEFAQYLPKAHAAVISIEDVAGDETKIQEMAAVCPVFVVTEGPRGTRLFIEGISTRVDTLSVVEMDATGAGDIFAAVFFIYLHWTGNPFEAAHIATHLAAQSITRPGLSGIPTVEEIRTFRELFEHDTCLYAR